MKKNSPKTLQRKGGKWKTIGNPLVASGPDDTFARFQFDYANQTPPKELFHYTSEENLLALISSGVMWATECNYLNDKTELIAGLEVFREALSTFDNKHFVTLTNRVLGNWGLNDWMYFVISLSERGDMLSQWRAYAGDATGCAVGLNGELLKQRAGFGEFLNIDVSDYPREICHYFHLLKVVYDLHTKRVIAKAFLEEAKKCYDLAKTGCAETDVASDMDYMAYCNHRMREFIVSFKREEFAEESEWRLVASMHCDDLSIKFRSTQYGTAPYTRINLSSLQKIRENHIPVTRIILGPKSRSKDNSRGLQLMLKKSGYDVPIDQSKAAFR